MVDDTLPENMVYIKLVLLGDGRVGKTSIRKQYLGQGFPTEYLETLGADFSIKTTKFHNLDLRYQIWDIAGQPRFNQIRKSFYIGAKAALILYDVSERKTLTSLTSWIDELINSNGKGSEIPIVVIANKIDLRDSVECVSKEDGENAVKKLQDKYSVVDTVKFLETSAKTGENVDLAFEMITKMFLSMHNIEFN
jgi:small GTP-binding protein